MTKPNKDSSYIAQYNDEHGNVKSIKLERPHVIGLYYKFSNKVDVHNQFRQGYLHLEKSWGTNSGFFREIITITGITTTDAFLLLRHQLQRSHFINKMKIGNFARHIVHDIVHKHCWSDEVRLAIPVEPYLGQEIEVPGSSDGRRTSDEMSAVSSLTSPAQRAVMVGVPPDFPIIYESYRMRHRMGKDEGKEVSKSGAQRIRRIRCTFCKKKSSYYCESCQAGTKQQFYCKDGSGRGDSIKFCYYLHICECFKSSGFASNEWLQEYKDFRSELSNP